MGTKVLYIFVGMMIIVLALMRHTRRGRKRVGTHADYLNKVRLKKPKSDSEFGRDVKWSIGDDD